MVYQAILQSFLNKEPKINGLQTVSQQCHERTMATLHGRVRHTNCSEASFHQLLADTNVAEVRKGGFVCRAERGRDTAVGSSCPSSG